MNEHYAFGNDHMGDTNIKSGTRNLKMDALQLKAILITVDILKQNTSKLVHVALTV